MVQAAAALHEADRPAGELSLETAPKPSNLMGVIFGATSALLGSQSTLLMKSLSELLNGAVLGGGWGALINPITYLILAAFVFSQAFWLYRLNRGECCCSCCTYGLSSNTTALITSNCGLHQASQSSTPSSSCQSCRYPPPAPRAAAPVSGENPWGHPSTPGPGLPGGFAQTASPHPRLAYRAPLPLPTRPNARSLRRGIARSIELICTVRPPAAVPPPPNSSPLCPGWGVRPPFLPRF